MCRILFIGPFQVDTTNLYCIITYKNDDTTILGMNNILNGIVVWKSGTLYIYPTSKTLVPSVIAYAKIEDFA